MVEKVFWNFLKLPFSVGDATEAHAPLENTFIATRNSGVDPHRGARHFGNPRLDAEYVVETRRFQILHPHFNHGHSEPGALFKRVVVEPVITKEFDTRRLKEAQVRGVMNHARLIGVLIEHSNRVHRTFRNEA